MAKARQRYRYPDPAVLQKIGPLELIAREVVEGLRVGMHKSPLRGFSTEFAQHRQYVPGDPVRHIDWRVYGRTGRYYLKLYEAETDFSANLLLDASRSMHYGSGAVSKLEYAKFMAASLAYLIVEQRDSVGLAVFDDQLREYVEPKSSMSVIRTIAEELEKVRPEPRTDVACTRFRGSSEARTMCARSPRPAGSRRRRITPTPRRPSRRSRRSRVVNEAGQLQ